MKSDYCRMKNEEQQELEIRDCRCDEVKNHTAGGDAPRSNATLIVEEITHSANIEQRKPLSL